jgi:hypothetical protein
MPIVVDEPIIDSQFAEPTRHCRMRGGRAELVESRRRSGFTPGPPASGSAGFRPPASDPGVSSRGGRSR